MIDQIQRDIEAQLAAAEPDVELLLCELNGGTVRIFIDHPEGVDLAICERVTRALRALRETYGLEVSSPGPKRPLTKPDHFRRFVGRRAKIRTRTDHEGRRSFTGELIAADDSGVTIGADGAIVTLPYGEISKSNLVPETAGPTKPGKSGPKKSRAATGGQRGTTTK
ncbi:MAG: ribosome maturation factor RimP [Solirubrobacterales bacterium]